MSLSGADPFSAVPSRMGFAYMSSAARASANATIEPAHAGLDATTGDLGGAAENGSGLDELCDEAWESPRGSRYFATERLLAALSGEDDAAIPYPACGLAEVGIRAAFAGHRQ
jgi:hypothetical protein